MQLRSNYDATTTLELQWCIKVICANWSINSCAGFAEFLKITLPGAIPDGFTLSPSKMRYLIKHALGPHFKKQIVNDITGSACYTLYYDETTNEESLKELHVGVRYYSKKLERVVNIHLQTFFLGHATGAILAEQIINSISDSNISMRKLLSLSSDGPNVNKTVFKLVNEKIKEIRQKPLIYIGTCNIHIIHNSFIKGLEVFGMKASDFVIAVYYFFQGWPTRKTDYQKIQCAEGVPNHSFIKHATTRWLTIEQAISRVIEQWPALKKYFLNYLPKHGSESVLKGNHYRTIKSCLQEETFLALLHFLVAASRSFIKFTGFFQREEPLIHIMYDKIKELIIELLDKICNENTVLNFDKLDIEKLFAPNNLLTTSKVDAGQNSLYILNNLTGQAQERIKLDFLHNVKIFYIAAISHIMDKIPLFSSTVKYLTWLNPHKWKTIGRGCLERYLLKVLDLLVINFDKDIILAEFKILRRDSEINLARFEKQRIDNFWTFIAKINDVEGNAKYKTLAEAALQCLTLAHGNATVERAFSRSRQLLTEEKCSMKACTLNSMLYIQDFIRNFCNNRPELVVISKDLLTLGRIAYKSYNSYLEEERKKNNS